MMLLAVAALQCLLLPPFGKSERVGKRVRQRSRRGRVSNRRLLAHLLLFRRLILEDRFSDIIRDPLLNRRLLKRLLVNLGNRIWTCWRKTISHGILFIRFHVILEKVCGIQIPKKKMKVFWGDPGQNGGFWRSTMGLTKVWLSNNHSIASYWQFNCH